MTHDIAALTAHLTTATSRVLTWLTPLGDSLLHHAHKPSSLPTWTNRELVTHIGKSMDAVILAEVAPPGIAPLTLAEYLGTYPERAQQIAQSAQLQSHELDGSLLAYLRTQFTSALAAIEAFPQDSHTVVAARRGPITLRDLIVSRLIEVVVHARDLEKSFHGIVDMTAGNTPVDPAAQRLVAVELLAIIVTRGGFSLEVTDPGLWIDLATGRRDYNTADLAAALRPAHTAGGIPDLGRMLPVL